MESLPNLDMPCSKHFYFRDLIECGEAWATNRPNNLPQQPATWKALTTLAQQILDPVTEYFGKPVLTFGFCSNQLATLIKKKTLPRIAPELDQHAGHELNRDGQPICSRGGVACDFVVPNQSMRTVTRWILEHIQFDRLYYYGDDNPLHISIGPEMKGQLVVMRSIETGRRMPRVVSSKRFHMDEF